MGMIRLGCFATLEYLELLYSVCWPSPGILIYGAFSPVPSLVLPHKSIITVAAWSVDYYSQQRELHLSCLPLAGLA